MRSINRWALRCCEHERRQPPTMNKYHPYHPIIYVRGFAASHDEIEEAVGDPYMGFNLGSTKSRQVWDGKMRKFFFESPIVRLKDEIVWIRDAKGARKRSDRRYDDVYVDGDDLWMDRHYEGGYIYRELIVVEATPDPKITGGWRITYGFQKDTPNAAPNTVETTSLSDGEGIQFEISVVQEKRPGIKATLRFEARPWT
jgi:hypothetical protein